MHELWTPTIFLLVVGIGLGSAWFARRRHRAGSQVPRWIWFVALFLMLTVALAVIVYINLLWELDTTPTAEPV